MAQVLATPDPWMQAMRRGDFTAAWRISDQVLQERLLRGERCWHWPRHRQFIWRGAPVADRRVLVRCYHGLGDTIQFIRFAAPLRRIAARLILWAQPALAPLMVGVEGVDEVIPLDDGDCPASYDIDVEIMELPHILRIGAASLATSIPYLHAPNMTHPQLDAAKGKRRIGFVWQAGSWDLRRSIPTALIASLLKRLTRSAEVAPFLMQCGLAPSERATLAAPDISSVDVMETAGRMRQLDLIVSVDTMAAHLAGALGVPTFTLLHTDCDWRWMEDKSDTLWYPAMRLFRQVRAGDWYSVIAAAEEAMVRAA